MEVLVAASLAVEWSANFGRRLISAEVAFESRQHSSSSKFQCARDCAWYKL